MKTLRPGSKAPAFALKSDTGKTVALSDFRGTPVILYFYPRDDSAGCSVEAGEFRDAWREVKKSGALVLGVSPDDVPSHRRFRKTLRLPFPLLADPDHRVSACYGVWGEKSMYGRAYYGVLRTTFLIGPTGRIVRVFERVKPKGHAAQVLEALR